MPIIATIIVRSLTPRRLGPFWLKSGRGGVISFAALFPPTPLGSDRDLNQKWLCASVCSDNGSRGNPSCWITSQSRAGR